MRNITGESSWQPQLSNSDTDPQPEFLDERGLLRRRQTGEIETRVQEATTGHRVREQRRRELHDQRTRSIGLCAPIAFRGFRSRPATTITSTTRPASNTNNSRKISGNGSVNWGEFWDGTRRSFGGGLSVKPDYHLNVSLNYTPQPSGSVERHVEHPPVRHAGRLRLQPAIVLQRVFPIQQRDARSQHEHPLQPHVQAAERSSTSSTTTAATRPTQPIERAFIVKVTRLLTF